MMRYIGIVVCVLLSLTQGLIEINVTRKHNPSRVSTKQKLK